MRAGVRRSGEKLGMSEVQTFRQKCFVTDFKLKITMNEHVEIVHMAAVRVG